MRFWGSGHVELTLRTAGGELPGRDHAWIERGNPHRDESLDDLLRGPLTEAEVHAAAPLGIVSDTVSDPTSATYDFDWIVIGSGFGGSVSALRLAEKGYRVAVLECGRRYRDEDFAKSAWNLRRYFWMPRLGLRGIFRMTVFKDVFIVSGSGVGGGSLGYANTLYRARPSFFTDPQWGELADWERELEPHYGTAEHMLGATTYDGVGPADELLREYGEEIGVGDTFKPTRVGAFFGEPGKEVADP